MVVRVEYIDNGVLKHIDFDNEAHAGIFITGLQNDNRGRRFKSVQSPYPPREDVGGMPGTKW